MNRYTIQLITILFVLLPSLCFAWQGKVVSVTDGDTIKVLRNGQQVKIRFYGIDTPEKKQAFGNKAKKATNALVRNKTVEVDPITKDRYGRTIALVYQGNINVNAQLVKDGYAWVYRKYCKKNFCDDWYAHEASAKAQQKGMWADPHIVPPWEWRRVQREGGPDKPEVVGFYHGNVKSKKFHKPGCSGYNCKNCTVGFATREEAIRAGYVPCGSCRP